MVIQELYRLLIEEQIKPSRNDTIFFLGDYIDRGPDAKGLLIILSASRKMITMSKPCVAIMKITC